MFKFPIDIGDAEGRRFERVEAVVGMTSAYTVVPEGVLNQLGIAASDEVICVLPNGRHAIRQMGQVQIRVAGREGAALVVFGTDDGEAVLAEQTLAGLFLAVDPARRRLVPVQTPPDSKEGTT